MKLPRKLVAALLVVALAFGVWGLAVSFTVFNFNTGDTLSAPAFNDALNNNFAAAEAAIVALQDQVAALQANSPVAFGHIWFDSDGDPVVTGTDNFELYSYNAASSLFFIEFNDFDYHYQQYYSVVQMAGSTTQYNAMVSSSAGRLLIYTSNASGSPGLSATGGFYFFVYKRP